MIFYQISIKKNFSKTEQHIKNENSDDEDDVDDGNDD